MQIQRVVPSIPAPAAPAVARSAAPASAPQAQTKGDGVQLQRDSALDQLAQQALAQADQLEQAWKGSQSGNLVSKTFNTVLGTVTGHDQRAENEIEQALAAYRALPDELQRLRRELAAVQDQPGRGEALLKTFRERLQATENLGKAAEAKLGLLQGSRKFWSGLTAEITSTLVVNGAAVMASRRLGLPLNAATAAAGFLVGGGSNVASHALLDSQYQVRQEGLGNFLTAGVSSAALVITARSGSTSLKRMATTQAVVAATTAGVGAVARESGQGFESGWQKRVVAGTLIGASVGAVSGVAGATLSSALPQSSQAVVQRTLQAGVGATTGAVGAGTAGTLNEAFTGFSEGWQSRVKQQVLAGAITGAVLSLGAVLTAEDAASAPAAKASRDAKTNPEPADPAAAPPKPAGVDETTAPPKPAAPPDDAPSTVSDETTVLDYARSKELQAFDALVNAHHQTYDNQAVPQPQPLVDADGNPLPPSSPPLFPDKMGYGVGYGTTPKLALVFPDGRPVNPLSSSYGPGSSPPPQLLDASGQPIVKPGMGYAGPPPLLIDLNGQPIKHAAPPAAPPEYPVSFPMPEAHVSANDTLVSGVVAIAAPGTSLNYRQPILGVTAETGVTVASTGKAGQTVAASADKYLYVGQKPVTLIENAVFDAPKNPIHPEPPLAPKLPAGGYDWRSILGLTTGNLEAHQLGGNLSHPLNVRLSTSNTLSASFALTGPALTATPTSLMLAPDASFRSVSLFQPATVTGHATSAQVSSGATLSAPVLTGSAAVDNPDGKGIDYAQPMPGVAGTFETVTANGATPADAGYGSSYGSSPYGATPGYGATPDSAYGSSSPTPVLYGPDGHPIVKPGLGYGSAPAYGGSDPYGSGKQLLGLDGHPIGFANPAAPKLVLGPDGKPAKGTLKDHIYGEIFQNTALRDRTIETFTNWTSTYSNDGVQSQMREAWSGIMKGKAPSTPLEKTVYDIYTTRQARWDRLAEKIGLPAAPKEFQLYRGVRGDRFVESVVKAWRDTSGPEMQVPAHELSSWSLSRSTAEGFAGAAYGSTGVVFEAQVPFSRTLADKYVDDGSFITVFSAENEVVVATAEKNTLTTPKDKAIVTFNGQKYTYADRDALIKAWDAAKAAQPAVQP